MKFTNMSRIGKKPLIIPNGVEAEIKDSQVTIKGVKGKLMLILHDKVMVREQEVDGQGAIVVSPKDAQDPEASALWGTTRALLANMIQGVSQGFSRSLEIIGVGFRAAKKGKDLELEIGFSHPVLFKVPEGVDVAIEKNIITISGFDRQLVGQVAAEIRGLKKPEPYKGKGIKYTDEVIRRKAGKAAKSSE